MIKKIKKQVKLLRQLSDNNLPYASYHATSDEDILNSRRLQAKVYLSRGNINEDQINKQGVLDGKTDPYFKHSVFFAVKRTDKQPQPFVGAARQITYDTKKGLESFQLFTKAKVYKHSHQIIESYDSEKVVEISGLVKELGESPIVPMLLYREMFWHSLDRRHKLWIMVTTNHLYDNLKLIFGDLITELGPRQQLALSNNIVVPAAIELDFALEKLASEKKKAGLIKGKVLNLLEHFFLNPPNKT